MLGLFLAFVVTATDQWSKYLVRQRFDLHESMEVIPGFFNLTYVRNTGAVWGILKGHGALLVIFSVVVLIVLAVFYRHVVQESRFFKVSVGLMTGGIIGNLIDRIRMGWVTDFLDFHVNGIHWPSFNIADSAICLGVFLYVVTSFFVRPPVAEKKGLPDPGDEPTPVQDEDQTVVSDQRAEEHGV